MAEALLAFSQTSGKGFSDVKSEGSESGIGSATEDDDAAPTAPASPTDRSFAPTSYEKKTEKQETKSTANDAVTDVTRDLKAAAELWMPNSANKADKLSTLPTASICQQYAAAEQYSWYLQRQQEVMRILQHQQLYGSVAGYPNMNVLQAQAAVAMATGAGAATGYNPYNQIAAAAAAVAAATATAEIETVAPVAGTHQQSPTFFADGGVANTSLVLAAAQAAAAGQWGSAAEVAAAVQHQQLLSQTHTAMATITAVTAAPSLSTHDLSNHKDQLLRQHAAEAGRAANAALFLRHSSSILTNPHTRGKKRCHGGNTSSPQQYGGPADGNRDHSSDSAAVRHAMMPKANESNVAADPVQDTELEQTAKKHKAGGPVPSRAERQKGEMAHMRRLMEQQSSNAALRLYFVEGGKSQQIGLAGPEAGNERGTVVQVGRASGILHEGPEATLVAQMLERNIAPGGKAARVILHNDRKSGREQGRHVVLNAAQNVDSNHAILSINGVYQDWVLLLGTKARNEVSLANTIFGEAKRELVKQSRRFKHNLAQVTYSRKVMKQKSDSVRKEYGAPDTNPAAMSA